MEIASNLIIALIVLLHFYFLWLEMFAWESRGPKVFKSLPGSIFAPTKVLAANQGMYNGFLAAGLIWSLIITDEGWSANVAKFFLGCVMVAGIYGAISADRKIFFIQALPAIVGLVLILFGR